VNVDHAALLVLGCDSRRRKISAQALGRGHAQRENLPGLARIVAAFFPQ
jgi:hypothetical protein